MWIHPLALPPPHPTPLLQVRRLYYPFLLHDPQLAAVAEGPAKALAAGGG